MEENNRMGNTRDLFKKIGDTKGPFHAKTGTIKHRNGRNLMKQKRLRRGGKNTQELYRKMTWITMMVCVVTQQEPDSLECEVKWALGSIFTNKASGMEFQLGDGIPAELLQILKDDTVKLLHFKISNWKTHQWPQNWKRSVFNPIPKKGNAKECSN